MERSYKEEDWVARSVYCNLCGHDWVAVFDWNNTTRLECPSCHGMSRINEIDITIDQ